MRAVINVEQEQAWNGWEGAAWADNASRYDAMMGGFTRPFLDLAAIGEDDDVLDIGCGTGQITLLAAGQASRAHVVGVDLSEPMLARARSDADEQGITNVRFDRADAEGHAFQEEEFDVVVSRGGVMFFSDPAAAFTNIARALRRGGRMVFIVPQASSPDSEFSRATAALAPLMRRPSPAARGMGSLSDPDRIHQVLRQAGMASVAVRPVEALMNCGRSAAAAAEFVAGQGPVRFNLREVDHATAASAREDLEAAMVDYETPSGVLIRGSVWLVSALRPAAP